jgi:hypothetical protein
MNLFFSDLWSDLQEKRLWPVAVALLAGLVAVPLVLAKPAEQPEPGPAPVAEQSSLPDAGLKVLAAEDDTGTGSALDVFDPKDPFRPPQAVIDASKPAAPDSATATTQAGPSGVSSAGGSPAGAGSDSQGGGSGGSTGGGSGGGAGGGGDSAPPKPKIRTQQFTYVIDVTFTHNDRSRRVKGMQRLEMLPSQNSPLLIFLGVEPSGDNAVFLVDSKLQGAGEGKCKPSSSDCAFLSIGAGAVHQFTAEDGDTYLLRIDQIRKVSVRRLSAAQAKADRRRKRARKAKASPAPRRRRFVPPLLADLIDVATADGGGSSKGASHR